MDISLIPKEVMLAWGIPGTIIMIEAYIIYMLFGRLSDSQEQRVKEAIDMILKYEAAIDKVQDTLNVVLESLRSKKRGK